MENIINGFEDYSVDEHGNVFSNKFDKKRKLKKQIKKGYEYVSLMKDNKRYNKSVHRIVAFSFLRNKLCLKYVDHIDGNKSNNYWKNLRWVTAQENAINASIMGLLRIVNKKPVYEICTKTFDIIDEFASCCDAERKTGISNSSINRVCNNKQKYAKGRRFIFKTCL